jgi:FixJ family two-component response regulator
VLDIHLGNGRSGLEIRAHLGARQQAIPIIFITGVGSLRASVWAMKAGALDFLEKPVDPAAFVERVRNALTLSREQARVEAERKVVEGRRPRRGDASRAAGSLAAGARRVVQPSDGR